MKHTTGRVRILDAMAKPGAYARPDLSVTGLPPQIYRIKPEMVQMFARAKMIVEAKPPKQEGVLGYVWVITDKGREWLKQAANTGLSRCTGGESGKNETTDPRAVGLNT